MRSTKVVLLVLLGLIAPASALHASGPEQVPQLGYFVTVAETSSSEEAKGFAAKVRSDGVLQASVVDSSGRACVELGPFALFIDAYLAGRSEPTVPDKKVPAIEVKRVAVACDSLFAIRLLPQSDLRIATSQTSRMGHSITWDNAHSET